MRNQQIDETLLSNENANQGAAFEPESQRPQSNNNSGLSKRQMIIGGVVFILIVVTMVIVITQNHNGTIPPDGSPKQIRMAIPSETVIELGNSRVLEVLFYSGDDDRNTQNYRTVTKREVTWSINQSNVISIDQYGRVQTLSLGIVQLKVQSAHNSNAFDVKNIQVVQKNKINPFGRKKRVINFKGKGVKPRNTPQKKVSRFNNTQSLENSQVPSEIKAIISNPLGARKLIVENEGIEWEIKNYSDGSNRSYILRTDTAAPELDKDKFQYFIGDRYLPGNGLEVVSIHTEGDSLWTINSLGETSHIQLIQMNSTEKAVQMVRNYQPHLRYGLASGCFKSEDKWIADIDDNDGLWTSMFGVGELMRYSSMKEMKFGLQDIAQARGSALRSLKAVLMVSNVASRNKTIDARIRHLANTRAYQGYRMSSQFLKQNCTYSIDNYVGNSMDGVGFFGTDAGQIIDQLSYGGRQTYTYLPLNSSCWSKNTNIDKPATTKRTLIGFIARSFGISNLDPVPNGGLFFKHNGDGNQTVLHDADRLYDFQKEDHPSLDLGDLPLPTILQDVIKVDGVQYSKSDLFYKGDTSTDEVIGHLFIYKAAFDILDEGDAQEQQLKLLIASTMSNFCTGLIDNGYGFVDATGQGTNWGKMFRDYINSDFTIEDSPIQTFKLLLSFKLCAYMTGDQKWEKQYRFLIDDPAFRYLDVVSGVWKKWIYHNFNQDYNAHPFFYKLNSSQNYTDEQIIRHVMMEIHYSDQEEAMLAYYLAFQLQKDESLLIKYREGLHGWGKSISRSQNPIWYFIYQLAYPNQSIKDHFGNNILDTSVWHLSRHPIDTVKYTAFVEGSRPDVLCEGDRPVISIDPNIILQKRKQTSGAEYLQREINKKTVPGYDPNNLYEIKILPQDERSLHKFNGASFEDISGGSANNMEPPTTYTLPYWLGVYHKMIDLN